MKERSCCWVRGPWIQKCVKIGQAILSTKELIPQDIPTERISLMPLLSCEEYRDSQQLLALKIRLSENHLDPEERKEIERLVEELEKKLKL